MLNHARHELSELISLDESLSPLLTMLEEAAIQVDEVSNELRHYSNRVDLDRTGCMNSNSESPVTSA